MMEQNRLSHSARTAILLAILAVLAACEKPILGPPSPTPPPPTACAPSPW